MPIPVSGHQGASGNVSPPGTIVDHSGGGGGATLVVNGNGTWVLNSSGQQITVG